MSQAMPHPPPSGKNLSPSELRLRWAELGLILLIAFGSSILYSLDVAFFHPYSSSLTSSYGALRMAGKILDEAAQLLLLIYVLFRQGRRLIDITQKFRWQDVPVAGVLFLASTLMYSLFYYVGYYGIAAMGFHFPRHALNTDFIRQSVHQGLSGIFTSFSLAVINPFAEELIVRAYLISEVIDLTGKPVLAITISVLFQTAYHLYQGILQPIGYLGLFFVFAVYYARTRRIFPVILAHMADDVGAMWHYL